MYSRAHATLAIAIALLHIHSLFPGSPTKGAAERGRERDRKKTGRLQRI